MSEFSLDSLENSVDLFPKKDYTALRKTDVQRRVESNARPNETARRVRGDWRRSTATTRNAIIASAESTSASLLQEFCRVEGPDSAGRRLGARETVGSPGRDAGFEEGSVEVERKAVASARSYAGFERIEFVSEERDGVSADRKSVVEGRNGVSEVRKTAPERRRMALEERRMAAERANAAPGRRSDPSEGKSAKLRGGVPVRSVSRRKEFARKTSIPKRGECPGSAGDNRDDSRGDEEFARPDKKLGNVPVPNNQGPRKAGSYLERYRRRFAVPLNRSRSPHGSVLSIFGDSQQERLTESGDSRDDRATISFSDDQSELSFYRRLIGGHPVRPARTARSCEATCVRRRDGEFGCSACDCRLQKRPSYRPYTVEDYRCLPVPRPDRSLGPDGVEAQAKREWLMRRRSYGDLASARNRQRILRRSRKLKSRRVTAQKCFLPSLKDRSAGSKDRKDSTSSKSAGLRENAVREDSAGRTACSSKSSTVATTCKTGAKCTSRGRSKDSRSLRKQLEVYDDSYLESLRQRHEQEKQLIDRLVGRLLSSGQA